MLGVMLITAFFRSATRIRLRVLLPSLLLGVLPAWLAAEPQESPIGSHLVGTILGEAQGMGVTDFRTESDVLDLTDFLFLPNDDLLIADAAQHRILRVGIDGITRVFAGTGQPGQSGDNSPAIAAGIFRPSLLAADKAGRVYVVEHLLGRSTIRRIAPDGIIQTIAGNGESGCPEVGAAALTAPLPPVVSIAASPEGTVYFFASGCDRIFSIGQDGVLGLAGVGLQGGTQAPVPPNSFAYPAATAKFTRVERIAVDTRGNVVAALAPGVAMVRITPDGIVVHLHALAAGGARQGPLSTVSFTRPLSVAALPNGGLVLAQRDTFLPSFAELGVVSPTDTYSIVLAEDGTAGKPAPRFQSQRINPDQVRVSSNGGIFIRDSFSQSIFEVSQHGELTLYFRTYRRPDSAISEGSNPSLRSTSLTNLVTDSDGNIYFGDQRLQRIYRLGPDGFLASIAGNGSTAASGDGGAALDDGLALTDRLGIDSEGRL